LIPHRTSFVDWLRGCAGFFGSSPGGTKPGLYPVRSKGYARARVREFRRGIMDPVEGLRAAMAAVDAYYKERGIFQGRFGFGESPALIIIDMAYGWTDPAYAGGSARLDTAIEAIGQLLAAARGKGVPVIYTTSPFQEEPPLK